MKEDPGDSSLDRCSLFWGRLDQTQFPKPYPVWLVSSFRLYVKWMGVILLLPISPKFLCLKAAFLSSISISLDLLCLSFSPCWHQLLLTPSTLLVCRTCSLYLPSQILALLYTTVTYCGLHKKSEKTVSKFHITKTFFPPEALCCLLTYVYTYSLC